MKSETKKLIEGRIISLKIDKVTGHDRIVINIQLNI